MANYSQLRLEGLAIEDVKLRYVEEHLSPFVSKWIVGEQKDRGICARDNYKVGK